MFRPLLAVALVGSAVVTLAADPPADDAMRRRLGTLVVTADDRPVEPFAEPMLRYTDPARATTDGTVWAFGKAGRPTALLTLFSEPVPADELLPGATRWTYEFVSLADGPLRATDGGAWTWRPKTGDLRMKELPSADPPGAERVRGRQMRGIARRFAVNEVFRDVPYELRLLDRPTLLYSDKDRGVEGALFAFAYGTNPEAFLVLEAETAAGGKWKYGFVRMGAAELIGKLDGGEVWRVEGYDSAHRSDDDPYHAFFETELPAVAPAEE